MKRVALAGLVAGLTVLALWLQRESARGTFDFLERGLVSWLAANATTTEPLPPMTIVLYDEEALQLAGAERLAVLDGALFARAAARLGAAAAGIEGLQGDPRRMIEAAGRMPVFGGYELDQPPGTGWTPLLGEPPLTWEEVPGLAGRPERFARGFLAPPSGWDGAREILLVGRNGDRQVPSFLVLAWTACQGLRATSLQVEGEAIKAAGRVLPVGRKGAAHFLPGMAPSVMTMNELLVQAERFEREGGDSSLQGQVVVLARATADVARVSSAGGAAVTPVELWGSAWEAARTNRLFLRPGWWFTAALVATGCVLALGPIGRSWRGALLAGFFALLVYGLVALAFFQGSRLLLPAGPVLFMLVAGLAAGRLGRRAGWLAK